MTEPTDTQSDISPEMSIPQATLESILCTEELQRRPSRPPDYQKENCALVKLVSALADSPSTIFQTLAETIQAITQCDSAGLSLLTRDGKTPDVCGQRFYWPAIAGMWNPHVGGGTPRNFGPCGDVLDQNRTLLFRHFERRYPYLMPVIPAAEECLLVPFYVGGKAVGTIWAIMHSDRRKFDAEDDRVMASLGKFASSAYQALAHIEDLKFQVAEREKAEAEVRELAKGLEAKIRSLVEANVVGVVMWNLEGAITGANDAFLHMVQYDREDLASDRLRWTDLTPAEWRGSDERAIADLKACGIFQPFEKEYFRKDGSRVPVLLGGALFEGSGNEGVAFVLDLSEQKRAEEALRRSEAYLAEAQKLSHTGSFGWDVSSGEIYWSRETFRIFEYAPTAKVTIELIMQRTHPEDRPAVQHLIERVSRERTNFDFEHRLLMADGSVKYLRVRGSPSENEDGCFEFVGAVTDMTESKRSEEALRRSEAYLAEAERLSHIGTWAWNPVTGKNLYWSEEQFRIWGFDPQQGLPDTETGFQRIHPEDRNRVREEIRQRRDNSKGDFVNDFRIMLPDTTLKYIHAVSHAVLDETGEVIEYLGGSVDVTERKRAEQELAGRLRQQAIVAELGQYALATPDLQVIMEKAVNLLADSLDVEYTKVLELLPDGKALRLRAGVGWKEGVVGTATVGADANSQAGYTLLSAGPVIVEDLRREARFTGPPLLRDHGVVSGMSVIIGGGEQPWGVLGAHTSRRRDFTKYDIQFLQAVANIIAHGIQRERAEEERERLRQLEADLAHINRVSMMGELTASLAHEIRQPITGVITSADACLRWLRNPPDLERARLAVERIKDDGTRAADVIHRLRSFYKKGTPPEREMVDVNEIILEMIILLRNEATRHSVSVRTVLGEGIPKVSADRVQLQQVFMNLMLNAIEAMKDRGGVLTIKSQLSQDDQFLISVTDTGVGLPAEKADQIFNAFFTTKPQGSGMGLAITRSIVESHGGRLWASANDAPGTTFYFTLRTEAEAHA
jgi:PAS domain S-box-containing protein